ncbi:TNF receptor-associated factor 3-like [Watersipora subatra]|uniref:TNF receptor-associated factor 3-like n=1 Tax=Watersipora subatra TaxID=2589382 RepID=UPI00355C4A68
MSASYEGYHIWKIGDFQRRKQEAGKTSPVACFSRPFYTSSTGYKMCGRACLNGEGDSYGKYLSLHFVLLQGEFDELLEFPFKHSVAISLLAPKNPGRTRQMTLVPNDETLFAYKKPTDGRNQGIGFQKFIDFRELGAYYIVEDCIYIRYNVIRA